MPDWVDRYTLYPLTDVEDSVHERVTWGCVAATAVPVSDTACGLEAALSVSVIPPVNVPEAVGVNVTEIVQLALAARLDPQLLVSAKLPEAARLLIEREAVPVFFKVTLCAALVVATVWLANVRLVGDKLTTGAVAAAVMVMDNCFVAVFPFASTTAKVNVLVPALAGGARQNTA